jgi:cytochrome oxidase Cu insertion factor (SCO1/SenC/PrrC family)
MRHRFALFALLAALALVVAGCGGDPAPDPSAAGPTTTQAGPKATVPPATSESRPDTTRAAPKGVVPAGEREPAPDLHVTDFDGRTITLGGFRGQPVVVNFFESW